MDNGHREKAGAANRTADVKGDGFVQSTAARWNRKGYGYNASSSVNIKVD
ncbi:hypothetical protein G5B47_17415 [Paenibacillus sp. 7124]|uniref:Uncharacterized protein n=1 Tax=Paenibacillus apii TaxID=1850370 RepID=A0A6M1PQ12_9BACL|nr:hypothetical protein [Paenibacillus apii]NGM84195.1 hypothetical protein [Paenibacillus apii]